MNPLAFFDLRSVYGNLFTHPLLLMLALLPLMFFLSRTVGRLDGQIRCKSYLCISASVLIIGFFLVSCCSYLLSHAFLEHIEPDTASIGWLFWKGKTVYHDLVTQERYSFLYGPYLYIIVGLFEGIIGPSVFAAKLPSAIAATSALLITFHLIHRKSTPLHALHLTAVVASLMLCSGVSPFWVRSDPFIFLAVVVGLFSTTREGISGSIILGLSLGMAINLKVHACVYFLPMIILVLKQKWAWQAILTAAVISILVTLLPFLFFKTISFNNYFALLKMASGHGFSSGLFLCNVEWFIMMIIPIAILLVHDRLLGGGAIVYSLRKRAVLFVPLLLAFLVLLLPASKNGAGAHHLMPFVPITAILTLSLPLGRFMVGGRAGKPVSVMFLVGLTWAATCFTAGVQRSWAQVCKPACNRNDLAVRCAKDLEDVLRRYPSDILLMGVRGDYSYALTFASPQLIFKGLPIGIAPSALMDFKKGGYGDINLGRLVSELESRHKGSVIWIIPKNIVLYPIPNWVTNNLAPFSMADWYSLESLFSAKYRFEFEKLFERTDASEFFEIYTPRHHNSAQQ